jgi:hypothetical protein
VYLAGKGRGIVESRFGELSEWYLHSCSTTHTIISDMHIIGSLPCVDASVKDVDWWSDWRGCARSRWHSDADLLVC